MSWTNDGSTRSTAAIRMYDGVQRVLPPASASGALSRRVMVTAMFCARASSAAASAADRPAAPWPTTMMVLSLLMAATKRFTLPWRGRVDAERQRGGGWGELGEVQSTPPRRASLADPPPPGEGEESVWRRCRFHRGGHGPA